MNTGRLVFFCGKMGAGKSTLARQLADQPNMVLISEDDWLSKLYPNQIHSLETYQQHSEQIKPLVFELSQQVLQQGASVILDFPANTRSQRQWLRSISDEVNADHQCYWVDRSDEVCIQQLLKRANPNTDTLDMFHAVTRYFMPPEADENINIISA